MKKPTFVENGLYHIYNRGVEKRTVFMDKQDHFRFIHDLFELNDENPCINTKYFFNPKSMEVQPRYLNPERKERKKLVEILIFTLMPNHFHLILKQIRPNGVVKFLQKLGTGYTMYFNKKYNRVGGLFQGRFKAVHIGEEAHFIHLPFYIHTNPLDLIYRGSTSIETIDSEKQIDFLNNYRWSSYMDYIGKKNFPSVISHALYSDYFNGEKNYQKSTEEWIKSRANNIEKIKEILIDYED